MLNDVCVSASSAVAGGVGGRESADRPDPTWAGSSERDVGALRTTFRRGATRGATFPLRTTELKDDIGNSGTSDEEAERHILT